DKYDVEFKKIIRILLIVTLLGTQFSYLIPINDFYFGVYNTAWFSAIIALILITVKFLKAIIKTKKKKLSEDNFFLTKSGRRGSNSRHSAWKADALPTELLPLILNLWVQIYTQN